MNSISTIFTMDIYKTRYADYPEKHYVTVGRISAFAAMVIALFLARPFVGGFASGFQTVQEYSGFIAPGIVVVFLLGFFWKRTTAAGAFGALLGSILFNVMLKFGMPDIPFIIRVWIVFMACLAVAVILSFMSKQTEANQSVQLSDINFATNSTFNKLAVAVIVILVGLYLYLW
jgi:solute:Na+ symporter, SSS family